MSEPTFSQRIRNIAEWLDSKVEIGSSSFDLAPGPVSQFDFELSEAAHELTMIAADLDRALSAPTAPAPTEPLQGLSFNCTNGCGACGVKLVDFVTHATQAQEGEPWVTVASEPQIVSTCCGSPVEVWDERKQDIVASVNAVATPPPAPVLLTEAERLSEAELRDMVTEWFDSDESEIRRAEHLARDIESEVLRRVGGGA